MGKYDLQYLYAKCTTDKKYNSHIGFEADCKDVHPQFSQYEKHGGQGHDAGFDSFMTGLVFATLSKYIEIGNIINKPKQSELDKNVDEKQNKRQKKLTEKTMAQNNEQELPPVRNIKHFSSV